MNKVALITWSSRGIGRATAIQLASDGYDIIIHYRANKEKAEEVANEIQKIGRKTQIVQFDITDYRAIEDIFLQLESSFDHIDLLVNNVGFDYDKTLEDYPVTEIQSVVDMVLTSKMILTKLALPFLKKSISPQVINIASRLGKSSVIPWVVPYAAAEAWVIRFTEFCVAEMTKKYWIRFNTVAPGLTDIDYSRLYIQGESDWQKIAEKNPLGRTWKPQDVANVIVI
jgi:NAD(P)-dependent dehydrogenase (short-subunit alcohol dehydrogenase family)